MKLEINLADREEIAAAVPLLQLILAETKPHGCTGSGQCHREPEVPLASTGAPIVAEISQDPAAVFGGGAAVAAPLPPAVVPSIAGAVPLPIAPEAMTANTSTAIPTPAFVPPAPTAPATDAPTASAAAPMTPASAVELDSKGLPWDDRIHAGTKSKIAKGEWKAKRGVEPALIAQVEAELRARVAAPVAVAQDAAAVFNAAPGVPAAPAPFVPPAAPLAPAAPAAPSVSADPTTFEQLMPRITAAVTAGIMPPTAVGAACAAHGVASVVTLQTNPQFVPLVWATLKQQNPSLA